YLHIKGDEYLELEEFGVKYRIDNRGFLQVNNDIKYYLYKFILSQVQPEMSVIDAYSGAGLLSAILSKKCKQVYGIEINKSASNSAKELLRLNNINNVEFICGDVKDKIKECLNKLKECLIVLDPPRSGVGKSILDILVSSNINYEKMPKQREKNNFCKVSKIIYISCNTATLARDLKTLQEGFEIQSITPLEMFVQTKHIEVVAVLKCKD
ncbi:MAG: class I SAM-dependent RNA methyltransferase, partial [Christensenellales bacterium]